MTRSNTSRYDPNTPLGATLNPADLGFVDPNQRDGASRPAADPMGLLPPARRAL